MKNSFRQLIPALLIITFILTLDSCRTNRHGSAFSDTPSPTYRTENYYKYQGLVKIHDDDFFNHPDATEDTDLAKLKSYILDEQYAVVNQEIFISTEVLINIAGSVVDTGKYDGIFLFHGYDKSRNLLLDFACAATPDGKFNFYFFLGGKRNNNMPRTNYTNNYNYKGLVIMHAADYFKHRATTPVNDSAALNDFALKANSPQDYQVLFLPKEDVRYFTGKIEQDSTLTQGVYFARGYNKKYGYFDMAWIESQSGNHVELKILGGRNCTCLPCCN